MLRSQLKTVAAKDSEATVICEKVMLDARIAEGLRDATKERVRALQAILNSVQTRAAFLKEEMRLTGRSY
jgi:hypothetical protein